MKKPESQFKEKVLKDLGEFENIYVLKTQERSRRGVPDILACINGKFVALELKTDSGKIAKLQEHVIGKIRRAQGFAIVTTPSEWEMHLEIIRTTFKL